VAFGDSTFAGQGGDRGPTGEDGQRGIGRFRQQENVCLPLIERPKTLLGRDRAPATRRLDPAG
jgi:hypothetical protein